MKKRSMALMMVAAMTATLTVYGGSSSTPEATAVGTETTTAETKGEETITAAASGDSVSGYELALVTDLGTIDDKSLSQGAWEGLKKYAEENSTTCKYYQPQEGATDSYLETIGLAIGGGAKLVVCPGFLFEEPIYLTQDQYPDVHLILLDSRPHSGDCAEYKANDNVMPILFKEDEASSLAGYTTVKDGYTELGFMGGMAAPAVIRYGYSFAESADVAAAEMGIDGMEMMCNYIGIFEATPEAQSMATSWYQDGTEVIFGCGGAVGNSVMAAAQEENTKVIGVGVGQSFKSETVITSAMRQLSNSVYDGIETFYDGSFPGGKTSVFTAANAGVGLPMETSKFETFTAVDYDAIYKKLADGGITLTEPSQDNNSPTVDLKLEKTTINSVE